MTTFTTIPDSDLDQDSPLKQSVARALRDNPIAISEGDASATHKYSINALDLGQFSSSGILAAVDDTFLNITLPAGSLFPMIHSTTVAGTTSNLPIIIGHDIDANDPDQPRFGFLVSGTGAGSFNWDVDVEYIIDDLPQFGWTPLSDTILSAFEDTTSDIMLGLGDNPAAIAHGADNAPGISREALATNTASIAGNIDKGAPGLGGTTTIVDISLNRGAFFPRIFSSFDFGGTVLPSVHPSTSDGLSGASPRFSLVHRPAVGPPAVVSYAVDYRYMDTVTVSNSFTQITSIDFGPDAIGKDFNMEKLRDNPLAIADGAIGAPNVRRRGLKTATASLAGNFASATPAFINLQPYALFPMIHTLLGSGSVPTLMSGLLINSGDPDAPGFSLSRLGGNEGFSFDVDYRYIIA